jgi:hypothetical protein
MTAKQLKTWRESRKLTITEAAALFGYTETHWRALEKGTTPIKKVLE